MNRKDFYFIELSIFKMLDTSTLSLANLTISPLQIPFKKQGKKLCLIIAC